MRSDYKVREKAYEREVRVPMRPRFCSRLLKKIWNCRKVGDGETGTTGILPVGNSPRNGRDARCPSCLRHVVPNSATIPKILLVLILIMGVVFAGWKYGLNNRQRAKILDCICLEGWSVDLEQESHVEESIATAEAALRTIFSSAQNKFFHEHGMQMANSMEELGRGYGQAGHGAIINEDIWSLRLGADGSAVNSSSARMILKKPYRYAVLPVRGVFDETTDRRASCVLALPIAEYEGRYPVLVMLAGPIQKDPEDFERVWPIKHVMDLDLSGSLRQLAQNKRVFGKQIKKQIEK